MKWAGNVACVGGKNKFLYDFEDNLEERSRVWEVWMYGKLQLKEIV
jgi:hypothetical protein